MKNGHGHKIPPGSDEGTIRRPERWRIKHVHISSLRESWIPAPSNHKAAKIWGVQMVSLEVSENRVDLSGDLLQLREASLVLDIGLDPLVNLSLGGLLG